MVQISGWSHPLCLAAYSSASWGTILYIEFLLFEIPGAHPASFPGPWMTQDVASYTDTDEDVATSKTMIENLYKC